MPTVAYDVFYPSIAPSIPGAPKHVVIKAIRDAVIEFCDESGIVRRTLPNVVVSAGVTTAVLTVPNNERICRVQSLTVEGYNQVLTTKDYLLDVATIKFTNPVVTDATLIPVVSVKPTRSATECDDILYEDWSLAIEYGAIAVLQMMSGRDWYNPQSAAVNETQFRKFINKAKHNARTGRVAGIGTINFQNGVNTYFSE
jgi:hypothetical protein